MVCWQCPAKEELEIAIKAGDLRLVHVMYRFTELDQKHIDFFFTGADAAIAYQGQVSNAEPEKSAGLLWTEETELVQLPILTYIAPALSLIEAGVFYSEYDCKAQRLLNPVGGFEKR